MKKGWIAFLAVLLVITACGSGTTGPIKTDENGTVAEPSNGGTTTPVPSNLDYCKMVLKNAQTDVNTFDRHVETIKANIASTKKKITDLKAVAGNEEAVKQEQEDLEDLNDRLKEAQANLVDANKSLTDLNTKCSKIAKKGDKAICAAFEKDLNERIEAARAALAKEEANLENIKKQYDTAKAAGKTTPFLASIDEEKQKKNLDILKIRNNIDKLGQMLVQLQERC